MTAVAEPKKVAKRKAPPKPVAKPGDKDFDWSTEYPDEPFLVFTADDGTTVGLAGLDGRVKPGDFRRMSHMQEWQATFYIIEKISSHAALEVSDRLDEDAYLAMMHAWTDWSGTKPGESQAP